jgi:AcrR family transcriptional regulator
LEAAKVVFSQGGAETSLEAVARHAGVGIGTLYRHFPTREALYEAVYRREVDQLVELAGHLEGSTAPVEALRLWMRSVVEFVATKKGMAAALAVAAHGSSDLVAYSLDRLTGAEGELLHRAMAAGEIRGDIDPEDLLRTLVGLCYAHDRPGWQTKVLRLVDVFIDGLRRGPDKKHDRQTCDADPAALMSAVHPGTNPLRGRPPDARSGRKTRRRPPAA